MTGEVAPSSLSEKFPSAPSSVTDIPAVSAADPSLRSVNRLEPSPQKATGVTNVSASVPVHTTTFVAYVRSVYGFTVVMRASTVISGHISNCFVEGIRSDYESMGYGAALNGILKGFPYLRAWDFRMDWCHNRELHAQGEIHARTNLCRVFSLALAMFVYAGILFLLFWRRRARVLKTGELPELGFIRKKIVGWMVEE